MSDIGAALDQLEASLRDAAAMFAGYRAALIAAGLPRRLADRIVGDCAAAFAEGIFRGVR